MMMKMIRGCRKIAEDNGALENDPEGGEGCPWTMEPLEERAYVQIRFRLSLVTCIYINPDCLFVNSNNSDK
jgi:hypothetical protein